MFHVALSLLCPVFFVLLRTCVPAIVAVPKAAVNKKRNAFAQKDEIRMTFDRVSPSPTRDPVLMENLNQREFRRSILFSAYLSHDRGTGNFIKHIRQF